MTTNDPPARRAPRGLLALLTGLVLAGVGRADLLTVTFDQLPLHHNLDGETVGGVTFGYTAGTPHDAGLYVSQDLGRYTGPLVATQWVAEATGGPATVTLRFAEPTTRVEFDVLVPEVDSPFLVRWDDANGPVGSRQLSATEPQSQEFILGGHFVYEGAPITTLHVAQENGPYNLLNIRYEGSGDVKPPAPGPSPGPSPGPVPTPEPGALLLGAIGLGAVLLGKRLLG